jgi:Uma2 family endonuclease
MQVSTAARKHKARAGDADPWGLPLVLKIRPALELTEDQLFQLCQINRDLQIERTAAGELLIMTPVGWQTGDRETEIATQLRLWAERDGTGVATGPTAGFLLPNGAVRAPNAAWVLRARVEQIPAAQRERFLPACPDFVLELRSPSDRLPDLQTKMEEYCANGARLGWLLETETRRVYVYRPEAVVERLAEPEAVSGDPILPGFVLDLRKIW